MSKQIPLARLGAILTIFYFLLFNAVAVSAYSLRGVVNDSITNEGLIQASLRVLAVKDSTLVKAAVTDTNGKFAIDNLKAGKYIVEASYVGCATQFQDVSITNKSITLPPFLLAESSIMLREATVTGVRTAIKVMEDTVEFNAASYKTKPNAVVEDLLKRLPGVEVDSDGKITANGKEIKKLLVDGKEFFSDDPTVASRNLPVDMIDKLQLVDRKSDLARMTGVDDGEDETVINLTVKKNMKNGWFGNVEAGYGTDDRYKGTFNVNHFWNDNQITLLGGLNNINEPAFTDGASGRFQRFGGANGITSAQSLGLNFNVGNKEIFRFGGDVMYSHTDRDTRTTKEREYLFADSTSTTASNRQSRDKGHNIRADFRLKWEPDSFNTFEFQPNFSLNYNDSYSNDTSTTFAGDLARSMASSSANRSTSDGKSFELGGRLVYNHKFASRRGRSFSIMGMYRMSNVRENENTYSWNKFYHPFVENDSVDLYDQFTDNHRWNNNVTARLTWTEPLGDVKNGNFLTFAYRFQYRWNNADKLTYDYPITFPDGIDNPPVVDYDNLEYNEKLSNRFRNDYMNQDIRAGFKHVSAKTYLDVGLSFVPQMSRSLDLINSDRNIPTRWVWNYAPYLRYRLKMSKTRSVNMNYSGRSSQPSIRQLQPVADMSNPMRIVIGNPDLKPSFTHDVNIRFQDFNQDAQRSIMAMISGQLTQNSIVSRTSFKPTGEQTTTYENVNGMWSVRGMNMISMPISKNRTFTFNNHLMLAYSRSIGFNNNLRNVSGSLNFRESFGLAWRPENVELELRPFYRLQHVLNSVQSGANRTVHTYGGSFYGSYYTPFGLILNTDLNYTTTTGYSKGYNERTWMWNAAIAYEFLKNRACTVTLRAYDLLGQKSNISRSVTANYIDDNRFNSLTQYFMLSLSYKFNTFGKGHRPDGNREGRHERHGRSMRSHRIH